ncbi:MAG: glycosyltransferase family 4 protein [Planctomycetes bacterium]|nr:glycosyltransferase family 4 protein [Planctomycetota bacterium]
MRIGIDLTSWANGRGYGRFTRELVAALLDLDSGHDFLLYIEAENAGLPAALADRAEIVPVTLSATPSVAAGAESARSPFDLWRMRRAVARRRPDLLFYPTVYSWFPPPRGLANLVCIHDAIAERFPQHCFASGRARLFWNLKVKAAIRRAGRILTVSETSKRDLTRVLRIPAARIDVAIEAPAPIFRPPTDLDAARSRLAALGIGPGRRHFAYLGGFNPHKQVLLLVQSFALVAATRDDVDLILAGTLTGDVFHGDLDRIRRFVAEHGLADRVRFTDFIADETWRDLAATAIAVVLPSLCEGFGLPAVEAAACGTPVIATTESPLPELLEGGGIFIRPDDPEALGRALFGLVDGDGLRARLAARALERASALSWSRCARATLAALEATA